MTTLRTKPLKRHLDMIRRLAPHDGVTMPDHRDQYVLREMQMDFAAPLVEYSGDSHERGFHGWRLTAAGRQHTETTA